MISHFDVQNRFVECFFFLIFLPHFLFLSFFACHLCTWRGREPCYSDSSESSGLTFWFEKSSQNQTFEVGFFPRSGWSISFCYLLSGCNKIEKVFGECENSKVPTNGKREDLKDMLSISNRLHIISNYHFKQSPFIFILCDIKFNRFGLLWWAQAWAIPRTKKSFQSQFRANPMLTYWFEISVIDIQHLYEKIFTNQPIVDESNT